MFARRQAEARGGADQPGAPRATASAWRSSRARPLTLAWSDVPARRPGDRTRAASCRPQRGLHARADADAPRRAFRSACSAPGRSGGRRRRCWCTRGPRSRRAAAPAQRGAGGPSSASRAADGGEFDGVRAYRRGDPMRRVVWKKAAREPARAGEPRHQRRVPTRALARLSTAAPRCRDVEERLSRLAAWVLAAERTGAGVRPAPARRRAGAGAGRRRNAAPRSKRWRSGTRWAARMAWLETLAAALARLAPLAARGARHAVPARRDRLDRAAAPGAPAVVVRRADARWCWSGAPSWRWPALRLPGRWA